MSPRAGGRRCGWGLHVQWCSKGAVGHDNVTFEGGLVDFVCQVPWSPGKVPSTPAVLRCPSARWIAPFSAGVAPFSPNRTPICERLRPLPKALRPLPIVCVLFPGTSKGYAAPRPYRGSGAALRCMSAPHVGVTSTFFCACIIASSASCSRCVFAWFTALRAGPDLLSSIGGV